MQRFADQPLGPRPHIAVLSSDKVGNFVVSTPLLRGLRDKYPEGLLDLFGSETNRDLEERCAYVDFRGSLYRAGSVSWEAYRRTVAKRVAERGAFDLVINLDGFNPAGPVAAGLTRARFAVGEVVDPTTDRPVAVGELPEHRLVAEPDWNSAALLERYDMLLTSNYIGEIFCRIAFVETDFFRLEVEGAAPPFDVPDVLIHVTTTRAAKMWPLAAWIEVARWCAENRLTVGLVGSTPERQKQFYNATSYEEPLLTEPGVVDLRGRTTLGELAGALAEARACVTVDAGPLHMAAAVGCPTVAVFGNDGAGVGASPLRLWAPRLEHVRIPRSRSTCYICADNRFRNGSCLVDGHPCMTGVAPEDVIRELAAVLGPQVKSDTVRAAVGRGVP